MVLDIVPKIPIYRNFEIFRYAEIWYTTTVSSVPQCDCSLTGTTVCHPAIIPVAFLRLAGISEVFTAVVLFALHDLTEQKHFLLNLRPPPGDMQHGVN